MRVEVCNHGFALKGKTCGIGHAETEKESERVGERAKERDREGGRNGGRKGVSELWDSIAFGTMGTLLKSLNPLLQEKGRNGTFTDFNTCTDET